MPSIMKIMGDRGPLDGGSQHQKRQGWFDIAYWSSSSPSQSGGGGFARSEQFLEINVGLAATQPAIQLVSYVIDGNRFDWLTIEQFPPNPKSVWYHLKSVLATSYNFSPGVPDTLIFYFEGTSSKFGLGPWPGPHA